MGLSIQRMVKVLPCTITEKNELEITKKKYSGESSSFLHFENAYHHPDADNYSDVHSHNQKNLTREAFLSNPSPLPPNRKKTTKKNLRRRGRGSKCRQLMHVSYVVSKQLTKFSTFQSFHF